MLISCWKFLKIYAVTHGIRLMENPNHFNPFSHNLAAQQYKLSFAFPGFHKAWNWILLNAVFHLSLQPHEVASLLSYFTDGKTSTERLNNVSWLIQMVSYRARIQNHLGVSYKTHYFHYWIMGNPLHVENQVAKLNPKFTWKEEFINYEMSNKTKLNKDQTQWICWKINPLNPKT